VAQARVAGRSGWVTFMGVLILIAGFFNLIWGITALAKKEYFLEGALVYENLTFWGWVWIIVGAAQLLTAFLVFGRYPMGLFLAILGASFSALNAFFSIGAYPAWAITVMVVDGVILFTLAAHADEFGSDEFA
jgi:hypothetical protein